MVENFTVSAAGVLGHGRVHTLLTSVFSHSTPMHLGANMFTLYFFGSTAIGILGAQRFLALYLTGGLVSSVGHVLWSMSGNVLNLSPRMRLSPGTPCLGASGAVNAVVAWYVLMFPTSSIYLYMVLPVPAALLGAAFIGKDVYMMYTGDASNKAHAAHVAGALSGALFWAKWRA
jgi:membrane associated rhomboid family serine protease